MCDSSRTFLKCFGLTFLVCPVWPVLSKYSVIQVFWARKVHGLTLTRRRAVHLDVVRPIRDMLYRNLFRAWWLAGVRSSIVMVSISSEYTVFVLSFWSLATAPRKAWAVISAHGGACGMSQMFSTTLMLGGMHPHSSYTVLIHPAHTTWRPVDGAPWTSPCDSVCGTTGHFLQQERSWNSVHTLFWSNLPCSAVGGPAVEMVSINLSK